MGKWTFQIIKKRKKGRRASEGNLTTKEQRQIKKEENQLMSSTKGLACVGTALSGDIGRKGGG